MSSVHVKSSGRLLAPREVYAVVYEWLARVMPTMASAEARCRCQSEENADDLPFDGGGAGLELRVTPGDPVGGGGGGPRLGPDGLWNQLYPSLQTRPTPPLPVVTVNAISVGTDSIGTTGVFVDSIPLIP
jgi:hypothetical protein